MILSNLLLTSSILGVGIVIYITLYLLNKNTPLPEGCENIKISSDKCAACKVSSCAMKQEKE